MPNTATSSAARPVGQPWRKKWVQALYPWLLRFYRLAVLVFIVWVFQEHRFRLSLVTETPLGMDEVRAFFPSASRFVADHGKRQGWFVRDAHGKQLGYVVCTQPHCRHIIGYCGLTDVLMAFGPEDKLIGIKIRRSEDTVRHVEDIQDDRKFLKTWEDMYWDDIATLDLAQAGIEGVSGATCTSMAMAESITYRCAKANKPGKPPPTWREAKLKPSDYGMVAVVVLGLLSAFTSLHQRKWFRYTYQIGVIVYLGFLSGNLLAQSLFAGWATAGINWVSISGAVLLAAAALVIPWGAKKPLYCHHVCPYGFLQQWAGKVGLRKWRVALPGGVDKRLRLLPLALLAVVVLTLLLDLPIDLASLEPFDAFVVRTAGWATIAIACVGLGASLFVPQAYCKYGCPTGALLEFVRSHGEKDHFGKRDAAAACLALLAWGVYSYFDLYQIWLRS